MKKTPLATVKDRFESKEKLVAAVQELATDELWLDRVNEAKGLARVSNAKLLRLHQALKETKERFGTRAKLVETILTLDKRVKDEGYKARLESFPLPRLIDMQQSADRRAKKVAAAPAKPSPAKKKVARSRKAQAKASASA